MDYGCRKDLDILPSLFKIMYCHMWYSFFPPFGFYLRIGSNLMFERICSKIVKNSLNGGI
jgi:hypothetical protein